MERRICPIAESVMTDGALCNAHVRNCLISYSGLKSDARKVNDGQPASPCQISWRSVKPVRRYGDFSIFRGVSKNRTVQIICNVFTDSLCRYVNDHVNFLPLEVVVMLLLFKLEF